MSAYTDAASRAGKKIAGSDDRELFARNFSDDVLEAWEQTYDFEGMVTVRNIASGKSDVFPIIGRKRDAQDHNPGELILGGTVEHNEIEITLDKMTVDSVFIPEIDELMAHYELSAPYSRQLGESLAGVSNARIGQMMVLASRETNAPYVGGPLPSYYYDAAIANNAAKLEEAAYKAVEWIRTYDIGGGKPKYWLRHPQHLLLVRYTGIDAEVTTGSGNRANATVGPVAGMSVEGTNSVPTTNVTTGPTKYQGDFSTTYGMIANPMAVGKLQRRAKKVVIKEQDDRLGTIIIASQLEGYGKLRPECAFEVRSDVRP